MSKRHAKKGRAQLTINALDAQEIEWIMRLHYQYCQDEIMKAAESAPITSDLPADEQERRRNVARKWSRQARKAWSYALQFHAIKTNLAEYDSRDVHAIH